MYATTIRATLVLLCVSGRLVAGASGSASPEFRAAGLRALAERFATFHDKLPEPKELGLERLVAFEENRHFVYAMGDLLTVRKSPRGKRRLVFVKPATFVVVDELDAAEPGRRLLQEGATTPDFDSQTAMVGGGNTRFAWVLHLTGGRPATCTAEDHDGTIRVTIEEDDRVCQLILPTDPSEGTITVTEGAERLLPERPLPSGVMPHGTKGVALIERWDKAYHAGGSRPWDVGTPERRLVEMVETGTVKPGRAVVLGCGSGTNAVYLASKGFDVTALDVAPTALMIARDKAAKSEVKVRWLLTDVLAPPPLKPFDFIFDRGCYHGVRRASPSGYVKTANALAKPGTRMLILAGNANEPRHYGPPRVEETQLVGDFAETWDFVELREVRPAMGGSGAWFWSALLRRRPN